MPALKVSIDGAPVATVCTDGFDILTVQVHGTLVDSELATLDISGGRYPAVGESTHLIWANDTYLNHGQVVNVAFLENAPTSHAGKTIDELFPDEEPVTQTDFSLTDAMFAEIRARPKARDGFNFRLDMAHGLSVIGETRPADHGFGFSVLWAHTRTEEARVSLHSYSLEELEQRAPGNYYAKERMQFSDSIQFELLPPKSK